MVALSSPSFLMLPGMVFTLLISSCLSFSFLLVSLLHLFIRTTPTTRDLLLLLGNHYFDHSSSLFLAFFFKVVIFTASIPLHTVLTFKLYATLAFYRGFLLATLLLLYVRFAFQLCDPNISVSSKLITPIG